jgi:hypothetical protein
LIDEKANIENKNDKGDTGKNNGENRIFKSKVYNIIHFGLI